MYDCNHKKFLKLVMHACRINLITAAAGMVSAQGRFHTGMPAFHLFFLQDPVPKTRDRSHTNHTLPEALVSSRFPKQISSGLPVTGLAAGMNCCHPWRCAALLSCTCRSQALQGEV